MVESESSLNPTFDPDELGQTLASFPIPRLHVTHGEGYRYSLGSDPEAPRADVEVYPSAGLIRYTSEGLQVTFRSHELHAQYTDEGVIFDTVTPTEQRALTISATGEILLVGLEVSTLQQAIPETQDSTPVPLVEAPEPQPSAPATHDSSQQREEDEKQPRVILTGRAGRDPHLAETKGGTKIAKFPLAVHEDVEGEDRTSWHTVVAFNGLAADVAEAVKKGQTYKVVGYEHERKDQDKTVKEIYAASVRPPSKKQQPPTEEKRDWQRPGALAAGGGAEGVGPERKAEESLPLERRRRPRGIRHPE